MLQYLSYSRFKKNCQLILCTLFFILFFMERNWKNIFRLNRFSFVIINIDNVQERLVFFLKNKDSLIKDPHVYLMNPEAYEINQFSSTDYLKKYALALKDFMENEKKQILVIDEIILNTIIKQDKKQNFLRFLAKRDKKMVLFCHNESMQDFLEFKKNVWVMNQEKLEQELKVFENFQLIKQKISKTYNPFKSPKEAFEKIKSNVT